MSNNPTCVVGGRLQTERLSNGKRKLLRDLVVEVDGDRFTIPKGMVTDYSSIPTFGCWLVHWSRVDVAGVVHDWLYRAKVTCRPRADKIWRLVAVAGEHHASMAQAWIGWLALRVGGWIAW